MTRRFLSPGETRMLEQATEQEAELLQEMFDLLDARLVPEDEPAAPRMVDYRARSLFDRDADV